MATQQTNVTDTPADIAAALSLANGTAYTLQNVDPANRIYFAEAAAAPTPGGAPAFTLAPGEAWVVTPDAADKPWAWTSPGQTARLIVGPA